MFNLDLIIACLTIFLLGVGIGIAIMVTIDNQWFKNRYDILNNCIRNNGCGSLDAGNRKIESQSIGFWCVRNISFCPDFVGAKL